MDKMNVMIEEFFSEREASYIIGSVLKALVHCNRINISHMDIKPENIMQGEDIKLIDFGLSRVQNKSTNDKSTVGSLFFIAPEIFKGNFSPKCDIWSLGVVLFQLVTNSYPFYGVDKDHTKELILQGNFSMKGRECQHLSANCKDLISKMLVRNPSHRLSPQDALKHQWFLENSGHANSKPEIKEDIMNMLVHFKGTSPLRKAALNIFVKMHSTQELSYMKE